MKEKRKFLNLMQGAHWLMIFNFQGVHPGFRRLKFKGQFWQFYILDASKILQLNRQDASSFL